MNRQNRSLRCSYRWLSAAVAIGLGGLLAACGAEGQELSAETSADTSPASLRAATNSTPSGISSATEAAKPIGDTGEAQHCVPGWICQAECYEGIARWYNVGVCPHIGWGECTNAARDFCKRWGKGFKDARWFY